MIKMKMHDHRTISIFRRGDPCGRPGQAQGLPLQKASFTHRGYFQKNIIILNTFLILLLALSACSPLFGGKPQAPQQAGAGNNSMVQGMSNHGDTCLLTVRPLDEAPPAKLLVSSSKQNGQNRVEDLTVPSGSALITVNQLFGATLGIVRPDYKAVISSSTPRPIENVQVSQGARTVAYLVVDGLNPANNYIETSDLGARQTWQIKATDGFAILGFTLEPVGKRLAFTEVGLRGTSSRQASWHLLIADLEKGWAQEVIKSETHPVPEEIVFIPFAWSTQTGDIYLYGVHPFGGGWGHGVWGVQPDGTGLRQLITESQFVRLPVLSPDGLQFAYLSSDIETLPAKYIPGIGPPPGNTLTVMDLKTGQERVIAQIKDQTFGALAWARNGNELVLSRQKWKDNSLTDTSIVAITVTEGKERVIVALSQPSSITGIFDYGKEGVVFWLDKGQTGSDLMLKKRDTAPTSILSVPDGQIKIVGYLE